MHLLRQFVRLYVSLYVDHTLETTLPDGLETSGQGRNAKIGIQEYRIFFNSALIFAFKKINLFVFADHSTRGC